MSSPTADVFPVRPSAPMLLLAETGETFRFQHSARGPDCRFVFRWRLEVGKVGPGPHRHMTESESFSVLSGRLQVFFDGECHELGPGDQLTVPAGTVHHFGHPGDQETVVDVSLDGTGMEDLLVPMALAFPETYGPPASSFGRLLVHIDQGVRSGASVPASGLMRAVLRVCGAIFGLLGMRAFPVQPDWAVRD